MNSLRMEKGVVALKVALLVVMLALGGVSVRMQAAITSTSQNLDEFSFKKGLTMNGGLSFSNSFYSGSDSLVYRDPYAMFLNGNLNFNLWGISMPFSFSYSNTQKSYTQPFNRFKLDPRYKWVHLLVGTNVMEMSKYTLSDHDFTGVGVELTPGNWNISGMYGRLKKAVEFDSKVENYSTVSYKRMGYAAKVGYDASFGEYNVTFFHGEDDKNSLDDEVPMECYLTPQENTAVSASVTQKFLKYFYVHGEYAVSIYNSNILTEEDEPAKTGNILDRILGRNVSERYVDACNAALGYQGQVWGVALQYERVAPYYTTLGGYYFTNDLENFTLTPNVKLMKGKLTLSGNFGLQYNNLNGDNANDTHHVVYSANASYSSGKAWNASLSFSNFTTYTKLKPVSYPYYTDALDSLNFYQLSRSLSGSVSYTFGSEAVVDVISGNAAYQTANIFQEDKLTSFSDFYSGGLSFSQQIAAWAMGWSLFLNGSFSDASSSETSYFGPGAALNKGFFRNRLTTGISCNYNWNTVSGETTGSLLNSGWNLSYAIDGTKKKLGRHCFSLNSGYTKYLGGMVKGDNEYEFLTTLTYSINF